MTSGRAHQLLRFATVNVPWSGVVPAVLAGDEHYAESS